MAKSAPKSAHFSDDYKKFNDKKWSVEVPEVRELINVIFAITPKGLAGSSLELFNIMRENDDYRNYYQDVLANFLPFYNHPIVTKFNNWIENGTQNENYPIFNLNSYAFIFRGNKIVRTNVHNYFWDGDINGLDSHIKELEDFALKTKFRTFYKNHQNFYDKIIKLQNEKTPVNNQWQWLEDQFPKRINNYKTLISPLVYGFHCTGWNEDNGFIEIVMSISAPGEVSEIKGEGLQRVIFTEIDHNYINPISDGYKEELKLVFKKMNLWAKENTGYGMKEYPIFNEYMTWAAYLLYIYDNYNSEVLKQEEATTISKMVNARGFLKFREFYFELLKFYKNKPSDKKLSDLFPAIIDWVGKQ